MSQHVQSPASLLHELLDRAAARLPDKIAVRTDEGTITYRALAEDSHRLASWLDQIGLRRGDRVALLLPNGIAVVTALMAASRIGAIFFIVNGAVKPYHLKHIMADAEPALVITTRQQAAEVLPPTAARVLTLEDGWSEALASEGDAPAFPGISSDPVCLIYTSGSTGKPKAVVSNHRSMLFAAGAIQQCLAMQESDIVGNFLPLSFDVGLYQILLSFGIGATLALGRDTHVGPGLLRKLHEWNVTGLPAVPSLASMLIRLSKRMPQELPRLRFITNTGALLPRAYIADLRELYPDCQVFVMFGLTECKRVSILPPAEYERKPDSVGKPLPDTECLIIDAEGNVLPPGEAGELVVRGPNVMLGYWRAPELTAKRFRHWGPGLEVALFTGDTCSMDDEGYLYFHGRSDDIYKQGGYRVSAVEVEAAACDIAEVEQAVLLPPSDGVDAALFVVTRLREEQIFDELRQRLEDYKLPPQIVVIETMPLTPNGKFDRAQLRVQLGAMELS